MSERKGTKALELWCKRLVRDCPEVQIDNMTTSWRNGIAFCALVHHFRPDLIDMSKLKPENIYENNQLAFSIAEKHLGIPSLLDPEDMVENDVPDRLSVLTYLSQFYQRLNHTVNTKVSSDTESKVPIPQSTVSTEPSTLVRFGKTGLDKCTACGLPVYLAQRLIVSHKLYHRRCFRCTKCLGYINPKNYEITEGSDFFCDSCKNDKTLSKYINNNDHDQMGMLAFSDGLQEPKELVVSKQKTRPQSILDKINLFEKNIEKDTFLDNKMISSSPKNHVNTHKRLSTSDDIQTEAVTRITSLSKNLESVNLHNNGPEKVYKSNVDKFNFLQTQLTGDEDNLDVMNIGLDKDIVEGKLNKEDYLDNTDENIHEIGGDKTNNILFSVVEKDSNITDDNRIAKTQSTASADNILPIEQSNSSEHEIIMNVPPRRKKLQSMEKKLPSIEKSQIVSKPESNQYPDHLNPFSDDEDCEPIDSSKEAKKVSTNPFGSSDEEDDEVPPIQTPPKNQPNEPTSGRRLIAVNPFWSDGEEPSSDEEITENSSKMYKSAITTSTPNLQSSTPRRKKTKAPPPPIVMISETPRIENTSISMDDIGSISSLSSFNSTINSEKKAQERNTPIMRKRKPAPTPPDSVSTVSGCDGSVEHGDDTSGIQSVNSSLGTRRTKGPAPGLPLPERREVKLQMSPEELQVQLDLLETQQLGLERQGVLIEKMIRDKCEGDEACSVPQEEVEDLVIQLCELVNEKNDLFRKQTELMYIRRQQRLEQEQADIEHEIRVLQSRPTVNRIDADKVREEQLVSRLVEIVRMRDELVQQIDAERRRERQEDLAIAASIANKRAQRNSESNSSSMKSVEVVTPKKNKVKDKVKKQFKKVKHSVISKKKDDSTDRKENKQDTEKKLK